MKIRNLNRIMMLIAGIITTVISIIYKNPIKQLMITLLVVLIIFFIIGTVIQGMFNKVIGQTKVSDKLIDDDPEEIKNIDMENIEIDDIINKEEEIKVKSDTNII